MSCTAVQVVCPVKIQLIHNTQEGHLQPSCRACCSHLQATGVPVVTVGDVGAELETNDRADGESVARGDRRK